VAWSITLVIGIAAPMIALAHSPSPGYQSWSSSEIDTTTSKYKWGASVPPWLTTEMTAALESHWSNGTKNNSDTIRFSYASTGKGTVHFSPTSYCTSVEPGWLGCATGWGSNSWIITIRSNPNYPWCVLDSSGTCWDVRRIAIHEVAHVGGSLNDSATAVETNSVMGDPPTGNQSNVIKRCDTARLQLLYGVSNRASPYPDCFDHITGHGDIGLDSVTTATPTSAYACFAQPITVSGRLSIANNSNYGAVRNNALASRTVYFDRRLSGTGTWTTDVASATTTSAASGNNWSKSFTVNGTGSVIYEYRAHYKRQTDQGVDEAFSVVITLIWTDDPDVC
jgi:hypothetical protein